MKTAWQFYAEWATLAAIVVGLVAALFCLMGSDHVHVAFNVSANDMMAKDRAGPKGVAPHSK